MKKQLQLTTLTLLLLLGASSTFSQERKLRKASEKYTNYAYIDAAEIYEDVLASGYVSVEILQKLGNVYYFNADYKAAEARYAQLMEQAENISPVYYLRYSQSLRAVGKDKEAAQWYDRYADAIGLQSNLSTAIDYMALVKENSDRYEIKNLNINTEGIDFGGSIYQGQLVYASTKDTAVFMKRRSGWDGLSFLNLYSAPIQADGSEQPDSVGKSVKIKGKVNSKFHESSACFTQDGKTMYFTCNNLSPEEVSKKEAQKLKIYRATLIDGKWQDIEDLSINSDRYSTAHPALGSDEDKLYFTSDRPGGYGETDLYVVSIDEGGNLGEPKNLGEKINTPGRETFPFVSQDNELYFSSDGHYGLGGLDVFYAQMNQKNNENNYGNLLNVGEPVNSSYDDFAYTVDISTKKGFFSSNRDGEVTHGYDDIYSFFEKEKIKDVLKAFICGQVTDKDTKRIIPDAIISLLNKDNEVLQSVKTDKEGNYCVEVDRYQQYLVRVEKETYDSDEKMVEAKEEKTTVDFELKRNQIPLEPGEDLAKVLNIPIIYFDFDKSNIRSDATVELEKIVAAMKKYPKLKLNIRSHTDSRGSAVYNEDLSEQRAQSTFQYIVGKGIDKSRLIAKGYGESRLINECSNDVPCTEEAHQLNRRSEFIVIE